MPASNDTSLEPCVKAKAASHASVQTLPRAAGTAINESHNRSTSAGSGAYLTPSSEHFSVDANRALRREYVRTHYARIRKESKQRHLRHSTKIHRSLN